MITTEAGTILPKTLDEFINWESTDGFKYEWNDGELIRFTGMKRNHLRLIQLLNLLFDKTKAKQENALLLCEQDVQLTGIQMRRPDMAYFSNEQIQASDDDEPIPAFCIEVISSNDQLNDVKAKLREYFKHGVQVVWVILPEQDMVEVYTSVKNITICTDADICSAKPVLDDFEISVKDLLS
ncbi:MAG: Uma2 family endonuclease [Cytophagales bacterium]|nr:MAG: Uma2 family endonuclease [Cytophagales bacterium]